MRNTSKFGAERTNVRDQLLHFVCLNLRIRLNHIAVNEPLAQVTLGPGVPYVLLWGVKVLSHLGRQGIAVLLIIRFDDSMSEEPFVLKKDK